MFERPRLHLATPPTPETGSKRVDELVPLVGGVLGGDAAATRTLLGALGPAMLKVVRRILGVSHPEVEDVLQESLVAVLDALPRFRGESTVLHFACRVAVLTAMNTRRRTLRRERTVIVDPEASNRAESAPADTEQVERREVILRLLDTLPEPQAEVLALHCALGYTLKEIAAASDVPLNTVRGRLVTAKQALRKQLLEETPLRELEGGAS